MASSVASESILFIAAVIAATAVAAVIVSTGAALAQDLRAQSELRAHEMRSDVTVINDPGDVERLPFLVLYIKNTGTVALSPPEMEIMVDGTFVESATYDVLESADDDTWLPGEVLEVTVIDVILPLGDHRAWITTESGATDAFFWSG